MNILVTGANGQLGNEIRIVSKESSNDNYLFTDIMQVDGVDTTILDITDIEAVRNIVNENKISCIINCAAYTNVDKAESDVEFCRKLNATAPANLAAVASEADALLIHISTDYVFGGEPYNTPCKEDQQGTPTGVYGLTKLEGEEAIKQSNCRYIILRTAWLYSEFGKNFVKTMLSLLSTKPQLNVVFDQTGTPTYAYDLAAAIFEIIERRKFDGNYGIYHFSNEGVCSWFDFTKIIAAMSGKTGCEVLPCHSCEFPSPVKRPAYSVLDKTKIKGTFDMKVPYWTDSLKICLRNMNELA